MTLAVELTPEQESRLREDAARVGMEPAELLLAWAGYFSGESTTKSASKIHTGQEWQEEAERFRQWADGHIQRGPGLSLDDMSRESIYGEHG